jgi:transcriptional regulator with XRE-family HTH domain
VIKLKEARKRRGISQTQLAKLLNVTQGQVSMYENGVNYLNSEQIKDVVKVLECSADYLLGLIDEDNKKEQK